MLRTLLKEVKEYKRASVVTPLFMILEVLMEMVIPYLMASIIDKGVNAGDIGHIYRVGVLMIAADWRRTFWCKSLCRICEESACCHVQQYPDFFIF